MSFGLIGWVGFQDLDGLVVVEVGGDWGVVGHLFGKVDVEGFDEESFAGEVELHAGEFPVVGGNFRLFEEDGAAFIEVPDDAPAEVDVGDDVGAKAGEALLGFFDPDLAGHAAQDARFGVGRVPCGVGLEGEVVALGGGGWSGGWRWCGFAGNHDVGWNDDRAGDGALVLVEEGVGEHAHELEGAGGILLLAFAAMLLEVGVSIEFVEAVDLDLMHVRVERLATGGDGDGDITLPGLDDFLSVVAAVVFFVEDEALGVVGRLGGHVIRDGAADEGRGIDGGCGLRLSRSAGDGEEQQGARGQERGGSVRIGAGKWDHRAD